MRNRISSILGLVVIAVVLWLAFVTVPGMKCESIAQQMQRNYIFSPVNGCWVQTVEGNYQRVDAPMNLNQYQP